MNIGMILKLVSHMGALSTAGSDFEQACKDLFAGKLTKDEAEKVISDVMTIAATGIIPLPEGITADMISEVVKSSENMIEDILKAISDIKKDGVSAVIPSIKNIATDLLDALKANPPMLKQFNMSTVEEVLGDVIQGLV